MIEDHIAGLRALLDQEQSAADEISAALDVAKGRVKRVKAAITALQGAEPVKPRRKQRASTKRNKPSDRSLQRVSAYVAEHERVTVKQVAKGLGISHGTAYNCLEWLRYEEQLRAAGQQGSARVYAGMPS